MFETSDQERWIELAEIARAQAEGMQHESARQAALDIASIYERLAREAGRVAAHTKGEG